jgi:hypothetical protein
VKKKDIILDFTSLLDVIMILLFLVMGSIGQTSRANAEAAQEAQEQLQEANEQIEVLQDIRKSFEIYQSEAVIVTMRNSVRGDSHVLNISEGEEAENAVSIVLGENSINNTQQRVRSYIGDILERTENQPVYIVFYYDKYSIYRSEFDAVTDELERLQKTHKEVFYKKLEREDE